VNDDLKIAAVAGGVGCFFLALQIAFYLGVLAAAVWVVRWAWFS